MTKLRAREIEAGIDLAVDDDAAADAGTEGAHHGDGRAGRNTRDCFRLSRGVRVVFDVDLLALELCGEPVREGVL